MGDSLGSLRRTHYCGIFRKEHIGQTVTVCGWVQRQRDLGSLIFVDVRDRTGIVQLAFGQETDDKLFEKAFATRSEYVVVATGTVRLRSSVNAELPTGDVEITVSDYKILDTAQTPPFEIREGGGVKEELLLQYRYLDLRRPELQRAIQLRHRIVKCTRDYFDEQGFLDIETPMLIRSTPEGARDYLVPSRVKPGSFFALPQSPQLYKQLLMLAGFDRYMQIVRCFRDEDLRADRQPEFTQIDLEMSFVGMDDVIAVNEGFVSRLFREVLDVDIPAPFRRMTYAEAMDRFGSDKPDLRFSMEIQDLAADLAGTEFRVFAHALHTGGVRGINVKGGAEIYTRRELDKLTEWVKAYGVKGLAYTRFTAEGASSSFEKFLSPEECAAIHARLQAQSGDLLLIVADAGLERCQTALGALRCETARRMGLIDKSKFCFLWVTDFPLFERDGETGRLAAKHHPFTHPSEDDLPLLESDPASVRAVAYDMVLNGVEIGGGSIRINNTELQKRMFEVLGFTPEQAEERFGFLLEAYKYGAPPHGGMAYGLDRLVMLMAGADSIREVMAFPKVQNSSELMSGAPALVDTAQLGELGIELADAK